MKNSDSFIDTYNALISELKENVFSHNDFQENNLLVWNLDKEKLTIIDFEYASLNFLGYDLASYFTECFIDYGYPKEPGFKIY